MRAAVRRDARLRAWAEVVYCKLGYTACMYSCSTEFVRRTPLLKLWRQKTTRRVRWKKFLGQIVPMKRFSEAAFWVLCRLCHALESVHRSKVLASRGEDKTGHLQDGAVGASGRDAQRSRRLVLLKPLTSRAECRRRDEQCIALHTKKWEK